MLFPVKHTSGTTTRVQASVSLHIYGMVVVQSSQIGVKLNVIDRVVIDFTGATARLPQTVKRTLRNPSKDEHFERQITSSGIEVYSYSLLYIILLCLLYVGLFT